MADSADDMMEATESYSARVGGVDYSVMAKQSRIRRSDPLYAARPDAWKPVDSAPTIETATRAPGEKRGDAAVEKRASG